MIYKAKADDYKRLLEIWEHSVLATHDFLSKEDFEYYKGVVPTYFPLVDLYIFKIEDTIKGFLGVSDNSIEMLFIDANERGQGIGKKLLTYAVETLNCNKVDVNEQNIQAVNFYQKFGFEQINCSEKDNKGKEYPILHLEYYQKYIK